jgi:cellulose 1,4-beta-cellobiosidase
MFGLPYAGASASALPITDVWLQGAPTPPSNVSATPGDSIVSLTWSASSGADSYTVKRATTSGGTYTIIASGVTTTSFTDGPLVNGTTYYYVIAAVNSFGTSANSAEVSATPEAPAAPASPTNLAAMPSGKRRINLSWTQSPSPGLVANRIYRATAGAPYGLLASIKPGTSYADTKLNSRVTYFYQVTAVNANNLESPPSNEAWATAK